MVINFVDREIARSRPWAIVNSSATECASNWQLETSVDYDETWVITIHEIAIKEAS